MFFLDDFSKVSVGRCSFWTILAAKVTREFNMCPDRWKLSRARKAALVEIHGDEEEQFKHLMDCGQELRRSYITTGNASVLFCSQNASVISVLFFSQIALKIIQNIFHSSCRISCGTYIPFLHNINSIHCANTFIKL
jgi:hypothetical protein